jgi:hypothetical protein
MSLDAIVPVIAVLAMAGLMFLIIRGGKGGG